MQELIFLVGDQTKKVSLFCKVFSNVLGVEAFMKEDEAFLMNTHQKPFGLVCWGNTVLQNTCLWICLGRHWKLCTQLFLTLEGHLPLSFTMQCLWHFSMSVCRRCYPPVVTTLQWRKSVMFEPECGCRSQTHRNAAHRYSRGEREVLLGIPGGSTGICRVPGRKGRNWWFVKFPDQLC